ncbi:MAG: hypothetical protein WKG06_46125 [Segetibacter sp.]
MELDDLKQSWTEASKNIKPLNINIMELIQNKSYGPLAQLKNRFRKGLILIPVVVSMLIINLSRKHDVFSDGLFWFYIIFCSLMMLYFFYNYRLINKMQYMDNFVKANFEKQVEILENGLKWRLVITRGLFLVFIVLLEVLMYYKQEPSLVKWFVQPLTIRISVYAVMIAAFYFITKFAFNYKYRKHVQYLKKLVQQMG